MAAPEAAPSELSSTPSDGPVLNLMSKRLRALRKKYNRILQMEESLAQGKALNKEQEDVLRSKPAVSVLIEEYEKLRQPLSNALQEELSLYNPLPPPPPPSSPPQQQQQQQPPPPQPAPAASVSASVEPSTETAIEDMLSLIYFGSLFDVKPQSEFTSTMLTRTHERECCLTYDYVTDDATDLLGEKDFDLISLLGSLVIARPPHSSLSHKNAIRSCVQHATLWLANSDQPIQPGTAVTYAGLRERLNKILASDYFTTTPEMKATFDVAAAAGKYAPTQVPVQVQVPESVVPASEAGEEESLVGHFEHKDEEAINFQDEIVPDESSTVEELPKDEVQTMNPADLATHQDHPKLQPQGEAEEHNEHFGETEHYYAQRRAYQNQRGSGRGSAGGRRGYANGRGGRGRGGGGGGNYQNGRSQYYDSGNYYPRNYYNARGRSSSGRSTGASMYDNHGAGAHGRDGHDPSAAESGRS